MNESEIMKQTYSETSSEKVKMECPPFCGYKYLRLKPEAKAVFADLVQACKGKNVQAIIDACECLAASAPALATLSVSPGVEEFFRG